MRMCGQHLPPKAPLEGKRVVADRAFLTPKPNTVELAVTYCRGGDCEFVPPLRRGGRGGVIFRPRPAGSPRPGTPLYPPFVRGE